VGIIKSLLVTVPKAFILGKIEFKNGIEVPLLPQAQTLPSSFNIIIYLYYYYKKNKKSKNITSNSNSMF
jgi:hypothetical protein